MEKFDYAEFDQLISAEEKIRFILRYAILAPSTHNTQPWLFKIEKAVCEIHYDPKISLVEADPDGKNLYISIGCLIENVIILAKFYDVFDRIDYFTNTTKTLIAKISFKNLKKSQKYDKKLLHLVTAIESRSTYRGLFQDDQFTQSQINSIISSNDLTNVSVAVFTLNSDKNKISKLTKDAVELIANKKNFRNELSSWMISNLSKRKDGIPGYAYGFPNLISYIAPIFMKYFNPSRLMGKKTFATFSSAPAIIIVSTAKNNKIDWIDAGRISQRLMLTLTNMNFKISISVAAIQSEKHLEILKKTFFQNKYPQFIMAAGNAQRNLKLTPRHSLEEKFI